MATKISGPRGPVTVSPGETSPVGEGKKKGARGREEVDRVDGTARVVTPDGGGDAKGRAGFLGVLAPDGAGVARSAGPATPRWDMDPAVDELIALMSGESMPKGVSKMSDSELVDEVFGWMDDLNLEE